MNHEIPTETGEPLDCEFRAVELVGEKADDAQASSDDTRVLRLSGEGQEPADGLELPLSRMLPVDLKRGSVVGELDLVSSDGGWELVCRYYDYAKRFLADESLGVVGNRFVSRVPRGAHHLRLFAQLQPGSSLEVSRIARFAGLACETPLTLDNVEQLQNQVTRRFHSEYEELIAGLAASNGCGYYQTNDKPTVGIITDDFMYSYYADAFSLVYLRPTDYQAQIDATEFDLILYISCWLGMPDEHGNASDDYTVGASVKLVPQIFDYARRKRIPCVFQTIEDPPNFERYLPIAEQADFIFTSAVETIPDYVRRTGNPFVFYLGYGVNPAIHNPIGFLSKHKLGSEYLKSCVFFAGSWYAGFPERCKDTVAVFDTVIRDCGRDLIIADRTLDFAGPIARRPFPQEYSEFIIPPIEYSKLQQVHKLFDFSINLNSVKDSETMGAMRVYEVQALGNLLVSNRSKSLLNVFPETCVIDEDATICNNVFELGEAEVVARQIAGIRKIFSNFTVYQRVGEMFERMGLPAPYGPRTVTVYADDRTAEVQAAFDAQTYPYKMLRTRDQGGPALQGDFATFFTGAETNPHLLEDALNAFKFTDVAYVATIPFDERAQGYDYVSALPPSALNVVVNTTKVAEPESVRGVGLDNHLGFVVLDCP